MPKPAIVNPTVKHAELKDGANTYKLVFSFNALATAEQLTKLNLLHALDITETSISSLRGLLYACLLKYHAKLLTIESAGQLLERVGVRPAIEAVIAAWTASQPEPDPNAEPVANVEPATP